MDEVQVDVRNNKAQSAGFDGFFLRKGGDGGQGVPAKARFSRSEKRDWAKPIKFKEGTLKKLLAFMGIFCLIVPLVFLGCEGDDGAQGPPGIPGDPGAPGPGVGVQLEQCGVCHKSTGDNHQASYDELYQDGVIEVADLAVEFTADNIVTTTFTMTKDGANFDCRAASSAPGVYWIAYTDNNTFEMPGGARFSLKPSGTSDPSGSTTTAYDPDTGECTITATFDNTIADFTSSNGLVVVYGADEQVGSLPARIRQVKYPFAALLETPVVGAVAYASAANAAGCEKCHTTPYLKHGYIYAQVGGDNTTDFLTCKACHLDNGEGGHFEWQLLVDDPPLWASGVVDNATKAKYAYRTTLMNDVHMSHAMEFPYPQAMANCVTCHEGKLETLLSDANFRAETCKSCHPVTGSAEYSGGIAGTGYMDIDPEEPWARPAATETFALANITAHGAANWYDPEWSLKDSCADCHAFTDFHNGYDKKIYADDQGTKYADEIKVTIDSASFADNTSLLTFEFSVTGAAGGLSANDVIPTVLVGLYGYDSKDFYIGPHERTGGERNLEFTFPTDNQVHPRITFVSADNGTFTVTADLSAWADLIGSVVKRVEIGVMPGLENPASVNPDNTVNLVALDAVSRTFDLGKNAFDDKFFSPIVRVATGCNNCHEALATTFHSPDRGGSVVVCRMCHITKSGGSHLEMQSRSIDSYAHAIHSFQAFDIGDIDFSDPVKALHYEDHTELFPYPTHGPNCESCHVAGAYNPPDQAKSLSGVFSASDTVAGRSISGVPSYIAGPGSRACGACHRAEYINEDNAGELATFNQHTSATNGYLLLASEYDILEVIDEVQALISP
jgi:OmcA/MtrC family decaheme c-type cytochrome